MATDETGQDPKLPPDARLEFARTAARPAAGGGSEADFKAHSQTRPIGSGVGVQRISSEPRSVAGSIGLGLDTLFGTLPMFFLLMLFFGFGVGMRNVMRISKTPPGGAGTGS